MFDLLLLSLLVAAAIMNSLVALGCWLWHKRAVRNDLPLVADSSAAFARHYARYSMWFVGLACVVALASFVLFPFFAELAL